MKGAIDAVIVEGAGDEPEIAGDFWLPASTWKVKVNRHEQDRNRQERETWQY